MEQASPRPVWPLVLLGLLGVGVYLYSSIEVDAPPPREGRPLGTADDVATLDERDDTNMLFVLIDTLRSERMSAYGYERDTTPFIRELAEGGLRFDRHISQSSWTKSSMASMWTGLTPIRAGITKFDHTISDEVKMPAEILADAGFKTVGLYRNGWVSGYFGFEQGFEKYYRPMGARMDVQAQRMRPNAEAVGSDENVIADAIEFLRIHGDTSRWFLYIHLMDLHEYTYDEESALFGNAVPDLYDNSIRRTDWVVSQLHDYMAERGLLDETIVVILSDHGEAFGERGFEGHARAVYPETTETPLVISLPFEIPGGAVIRSKTTNLDLWPTLLDLIGLPDQGEIDGHSRKDEVLAAVLEATHPEEEVELPTEEGDFSVAFLDENWGRPGTERAPAISVVEGDYRYVRGTDFGGRSFEVLLTVADDQREDVKEAHPQIFERLKARAQAELENQAVYASDEIELDEMQLDQLRALGYSLP